MAKRKNSVALFEVIKKSKDRQRDPNLTVPTWMDGQEPGAAEGQYRPAPGEAGPPRAAKPVAQVPARPPAIDAELGRVHLSLTYVTCAIVAGAFVVLLIGSFLLGRSTAPQGDGTGPARAGFGTSPGVTGPNDDSRNGGAPGVDNTGRTPQKWYLVIQATGGATEKDRNDARKMAKFCNESNKNKFRADVWRFQRDQRWFVWSFRAFDDPSSPEAIKFAKEIEELGEKYADTHGGYDFRQRRSRSNKLEPFYRLYKKDNR